MEKPTPEIARTAPAIGLKDRLSSLPDEIISHILSFLPTKYAVGTAMLSRRWKDHCASVSNLDFDDNLAYEPPSRKIVLLSLPPDGKLKSQGLKKVPYILWRNWAFCLFVYKVLSKHTNLNSVRRFRFHCSATNRFLKLLATYRFQNELVFGTLVEEIDVRIREVTEFGIPESFYTLENLKVAKLSGVVMGAIQGSVVLPSLKILELSFMEIKDVGSFSRLISGCPVLETVHLENCYPSSRNDEYIEASSPSLKSLKIIHSAVVIEAPNREDLYFGKIAQWKFKGISPLSCLHSADVDLDEHRSSYLDLIGLLTAISNAKNIRLYGPFLGRLSRLNNHVQFPVFPNLTHLTIGNGGRSLFLHSLLNSAPVLQSLVIDLRSPGGSMLWKRLDTACTPVCLLSSLEVIEIKGVVEFGDDWKMIVYLLRAEAVLKKVNMHLYSCDHEVTGRTDFVSLRRQSRGPGHWEARLLLPDNQEICVDDEAQVEGDVDDYFVGIDDDTDSETDREVSNEEWVYEEEEDSDGGQEGAAE